MKNSEILQSSEAAEQCAVIEWCNIMAYRYRYVDKIFHIPNGGKRDKIEAAHLSAQGVKKGVPDLCLPVPCGGYHGLYIEMKYGKGRTSSEQEEWLSFLAGQGYKCAVCYSAEEAICMIEKYYKSERGIKNADYHD